MSESEIEPGVFVHDNGDIKIHLNTASDADGNGINVVPNEPLPGDPTLALTYSAIERLARESAERRS